jgi:septum formation topological specificity factor MinE
MSDDRDKEAPQSGTASELFRCASKDQQGAIREILAKERAVAHLDKRTGTGIHDDLVSIIRKYVP